MQRIVVTSEMIAPDIPSARRKLPPRLHNVPVAEWAGDADLVEEACDESGRDNDRRNDNENIEPQRRTMTENRKTTKVLAIDQKGRGMAATREGE